MSNTDTAATATLDLFGEHRTVELRSLSGGPAEHVAFVYGFVATIGRGVARYPADLTLWRITDEKPASRGNYRVTASDGSEWQYHLSTVARNRTAQIVGFADVRGVTNREDQTRTAAS